MLKNHLLIVALLMISLIVLTGCSAKQVVKTELIEPKQAAIPEKPVFSPVAWSKCGDKYCVDAAGAKALMINWVMLNSWGDDLVLILKGQRAVGSPKK